MDKPRRQLERRAVRRRVPRLERSWSCRQSGAAFPAATWFLARPVEMQRKERKSEKKEKKPDNHRMAKYEQF